MAEKFRAPPPAVDQDEIQKLHRLAAKGMSLQGDHQGDDPQRGIDPGAGQGRRAEGQQAALGVGHCNVCSPPKAAATLYDPRRMNIVNAEPNRI